MKKKVMVLSIMAAAFISLGIISFQTPSEARSMFIPDAGNKKCLVTGQELTSKKVYRVYNGKRYWFSSLDAAKKFEQEPIKYIKNYYGKR
ncbi:MAG: hypothetical protein PHH49_08225 [Candidatus Omnitrophica bacterium]|nr:hypothetical protein [Candidatus Omnitrophota bacterium]MDD5488924.1 hypothetical protein [Candidatus Omnitrophota bacterium]